MKQFTMPIIFWLMTIEDKKIREAAIRNCDYLCNDDRYIVEVGSFRDALAGAFLWKYTPEGHDSWERVFNLQISN